MLVKLEWLGYRTVKKNYNNMWSRFHLILERYGQTDVQRDRQTNGQNWYINIARRCADARWKRSQPISLKPGVIADRHRLYPSKEINFSWWSGHGYGFRITVPFPSALRTTFARDFGPGGGLCYLKTVYIVV